jgi:hypothetical protein
LAVPAVERELLEAMVPAVVEVRDLMQQLVLVVLELSITMVVPTL